MPIDRQAARQRLQQFDFSGLFTQELGWDWHTATVWCTIAGEDFELVSVAHKRGFVVWHCTSPTSQFPDATSRRKIEREAAKAAHEHLIIFTDDANTRQVWQWVRRDHGQPLRVRDEEWTTGSSGEAILQKLDPLFVSLDDEEAITLTDITARARANVSERVTKKFYEEFRRQHGAFSEFITGIPNQGDHAWYTSVMLNRLMFVYFVQKKGFLDGDTNYLRNRLNQLKAQHKGDKFYSFYRAFLLRLFHEGLGGKKRKSEVEKLIGRVPYLNGGIFDVHQLERDYGDAIQISDQAFEGVFDYFDRYHWHLDERPLRADNEINPDVLGYIFEKYINQKQMGAYYTKEDITEYISKSCIIPFLFDSARTKCKVAFDNADGPTIWELLKENPDRYIYPAVRHGCELPLPEEIAAGLDTDTPGLIERRKPWNKAAPAEHALPTEIWRETIARRLRYEEVRAKLAKGDVREINDFITLNIDLRQFAQDVIQHCEGPDLLIALWNVLRSMSILDPTGGSGAFVFAALSILEPLYEGCLDRMQDFIHEWGENGKKAHPNYHKKFSDVLAQVAAHPNRRYFVLKSIILNNLYAVDIMEEAVEICKLRLFLKLAAQVEADPEKDNYGIEPLPDIDFNIRCGNTLVGYATYDEVKRAITSGLDFDNAMEKIDNRAVELQQYFDSFRKAQTEGDGVVPAEHKKELQKRLKALDDELNRHLAGEYGVKINDKNAYNTWLESHQPFHWFIQFYGILNSGGFDVIIGNPPYVEYSEIKRHYTTPSLGMVQTGNLYSLTIERCSSLIGNRSVLGVIVPISSISTARMLPLMSFFKQDFDLLFVSNFAVRPGKLFVGVDMNLSIFIARMNRKNSEKSTFSTNYNRWNEEARSTLFSLIRYVPTEIVLSDSNIRKIGDSIESNLLKKLESHPRIATVETKIGGEELYYHSGGRYYRKCLREKLSSEYKPLRVKKGYGPAVTAVITSSLYYWLWIVVSDCYHVTKGDIAVLPIPKKLIEDPLIEDLSDKLLTSLWNYSEKRVRNRKDGTCKEEINFKVGKSKPIIDEIDTVLAKHYGFTEEELDFIINYDIKYRMGRGAGEEED